MAFTEPIRQGRSSGRGFPSTPLTASTSNGIADRCAGAMGFEIGQLARSNSGLSQRFANDGLLRRSVGSGDARGAAVLIHGRSSDERENMIAIAQRIGKALEDDRAAAFGANVAVGLGVEGLAAAVRGHHARMRKSDGDFRREDQIDGAGNGQIGSARCASFRRPCESRRGKRNRRCRSQRLGRANPASRKCGSPRCCARCPCPDRR